MTLATLESVCASVKYGYTASASDVAVGPKFLRITDIVPDQIDWASVPYCSIEDVDRAKFGLKQGDIVVARTGATVGYAKLIREPVDAVFASYLVRFRVDSSKADPGFIGKLVESTAYKAFVRSRIGGAAQPNASAPVLGSFSFHLPSPAAQKRIFEISSIYDDLIENNRRRIKLLEESARLLYREWFVHLRFPGHEHVKVVDGVPEGWERKSLGEVAFLNYGRALKEQDRESGDFPVYGSSGIVGTHKVALSEGPGIIVGRKGNVGKIFWSYSGFFPIDTVYFVDAQASNLHLYYALQNTQFISTDVAVPGLNRDFAHSRPIMIPEKIIFEGFLDLIEPIHQQINNFTQYNTKLRQARDLLLPRLMSGEIAV